MDLHVKTLMLTPPQWFQNRRATVSVSYSARTQPMSLYAPLHTVWGYPAEKQVAHLSPAKVCDFTLAVIKRKLILNAHKNPLPQKMYLKPLNKR